MATRTKKAETKAATTTAAKAAPETKTTAQAAATPKKTTTRKTTRKAAPKLNTEVYIQFWGKEVYAKDIVSRIKDVWTNEMGKKESELLDLKVYIKPEENAAHYVINGDTMGYFCREQCLCDIGKKDLLPNTSCIVDLAADPFSIFGTNV